MSEESLKDALDQPPILEPSLFVIRIICIM